MNEFARISVRRIGNEKRFVRVFATNHFVLSPIEHHVEGQSGRSTGRRRIDRQRTRIGDVVDSGGEKFAERGRFDRKIRLHREHEISVEERKR